MKLLQRLSLASKFYLALVLPLIIVFSFVITVTYFGLKENAESLTDALKIQNKTNQILPLLIKQDDASKAMLIDPKYLDTYSERKIDAYDLHKELLKEVNSQSIDVRQKNIIKELNIIDEKLLRPIDTEILETIFDDITLARAIYFEKYEKEKSKYENLIRKLKDLSEENVNQANIVMNEKNDISIFNILASLIIGIFVVVAVIFILSKRVEKSRKNVESLLTSLNEGLFFFDKTGFIPQERSMALSKIFPKHDKYENIFTFFGAYTDTDSSKLKLVLELLWQDPNDDFFSDFSATVTMLPRRLSIKRETLKEVQIEYKAVYDNKGNLEKVVGIAEDITSRLKAEKQALLQAERIQKITKAASNAEVFKEFAGEIDGLMSRITAEFSRNSGKVNFVQLKRDLHTVKGSIGAYDFSSLAQKIHEIEDLVNEFDVGENGSLCLEKWEDVKINWNLDIEDIYHALGISDENDRISVERMKIDRVVKLSKNMGNSELRSACESLTRESAAVAFGSYRQYIDKLCEKVTDKKAGISFLQGVDEISLKEAQKIQGAIIHIVRNCFDHGIESIDKRNERGKNPEGTISIGVTRSDDQISVIVSDDGGGIDGEKLAKKAVLSGFWTQEKLNESSEEEKLDLIFVPNLSSAEEVTDISGRGVGMDAVKDLVEGLNGKIQINSVFGQGSQFILSYPPITSKSDKSNGKIALKLNVMIVDDDEDICSSISEVASSYGFEVKVFSSGRQALENIDEFCPEILLTDFYMPDMNGHQLLMEIRKKFPDLPVVLCSGYVGTDITKAYIKDFDYVFDKPIEWDCLASKLYSLASKYREMSNRDVS